MNVSDIVTYVKRSFGDESGAQITDDDLFRWINAAQEEIANDNQSVLETTGTADIVAGQSDYSVPADLNMLRSLQFNGVHLNKMSFNEFNLYLDGFRKTNPPTYGNGIPDAFMVWNDTITIFPTPQQSIIGGLIIYYIRHPTAIANFADTLTVPVHYHKAIVDFCLQQAYELDEDVAKANMKKTEYNDRLMKMSNRKQEDEEYYPTITTLPEDENFGSWGFWGGYS